MAMACTVNPSVSSAGSSSSSSFSGLPAPSRSSSCLSLSVFTLHRTQHAYRTLIMCAPPQATAVSLCTSHAQVHVPALKAKTRPETDPLRLRERYLEWNCQHKDFGLYMDVSRIGSLMNLSQKWRRKWSSLNVAQFSTQMRSEWFGTTGYASPSLPPQSSSKSKLKMHLTELACLQLMLLVVPCFILQRSWAKCICSGQKCLSKSAERDASALTIVQVAFNDLVKHALRFHMYFKNLQSQLREPEIFKSFAAHDWLKLIRLLHQNLKRKTVIVILGSVMAGMLIMVGAPVTSPNVVTWALTEENLIFLEAWRTIDRAYIDKTFNGQSWFRYREEALRREPMNNREQTYDAIKKMLMTLEDPFTRFLEPEKFNTLRTGTRGAVTGVGLEVGFESNGANADLVVIAPVIGGPAERVGIVPGDIISEIDGMSTSGLGLYEAAQRLQGPESSEVKLTVQKKQSGSSKNIVLVREKIKINPVSWRLCEVTEGKKSVQIGYIRLATFNENASSSIKEAIQKLKESGATAFVLDMRNNSGGLFPAGIEIAKMWLEKGVIVYITDSKGIRDIYEADGYGTIATDEPLTVLVNKGTASASEILAGALKDNKRATILGEPTFGKGKIQSVFELSDGSGMAVTVARYETPAHVDIDKVGITPDHSLPALAPLDKEDFCRCLIDPSLPCYMPPSTFFPSLMS